MRELELFLAAERLLLAARLPAYRPLPRGASPVDRLHRVGRSLLALGGELREELPRPVHFVRTAAIAAVEVALLAAAPGARPVAAVGRLADLQRERLRDCGPSFLRTFRWRGRRPEVHLGRAFWNLAGLGSELARGEGGGLLEEHAADTTNYLVFVAFGSGAFELAVGEEGVFRAVGGEVAGGSGSSSSTTQEVTP